MQHIGKNKMWLGLVDYANAPDLETNAEALKSFGTILFYCMPWMARTAYDDDVPAMITALINREALFRQVGGRQVWLSFKSEEQLTNQFRQQAVEFQPQVRQLLTWLSDREHNEQERSHAFGFLREHMQHIEFQRGDPAFAPDEDVHRYFDFRGDLKDDFPHRTFFYKDVADVICDFVQKEHELGKDVPIRICKRPRCRNLVAQFKKRKYCRTTLCDRERQKRDDDLKLKKNRDNVFLCRLRKMPPATRRRAIRASSERLREIESYWRDRNKSLAKHALKLLNAR